MNAEAKVENAGALVAVVNSNAQVNNSTINATIYATVNAGGVVAINNSTVANVTGIVNVKFNGTTEASIGGVVATNDGAINNVNLTANISIENAGGTQNVGGVAGVNDGYIENVTISGDKISVDVNTTNKINIGGVVATNYGTIENTVNSIAKVGTYYVGANHYVGGVVAINHGAISKVLTQSDLYGNHVSGVVNKMFNSAATIDQVVVGKYDAENKTLTQNEIQGDKYLAGVVVDLRAGKITNVQSSSKLVGTTNATRSSLVALVFGYGSSLKSATINSSFEGYGERYREVWTDFANFSNKGEFSVEAGDTYDGRFNLYFQDVHHGSMQSVVINGNNAGVSGAKASMGNAFAFTVDYQDTEESSFIKVVNGFNDVSQFQGSFTFICAKSTVFGIEHEATKTLSFDLGSVWESNNGISLMFLNNID